MKILDEWAIKNKLVLLEVDNKPYLRVFYLSEDVQCLQVVIEDKGETYRVDVWSVETADDKELHYDYEFSRSDLISQLDIIVTKVRSWLCGNNIFP